MKYAPIFIAAAALGGNVALAADEAMPTLTDESNNPENIALEYSSRQAAGEPFTIEAGGCVLTGQFSEVKNAEHNKEVLAEALNVKVTIESDDLSLPTVSDRVINAVNLWGMKLKSLNMTCN